jgi:hypothetical protein
MYLQLQKMLVKRTMGLGVNPAILSSGPALMLIQVDHLGNKNLYDNN